MARDSDQFSIQALSGGKAVPERIVRRGMTDLERTLDASFREHRRLQVAHARAMSDVASALRKSADGDAFARTVKQLRALDQQHGRRKVENARAGGVEPRAFTASIGLTRVPPLDYQWTWNATSGNPSVAVNAQRTTGALSFSLWNASNDASAWARNAVGIYFRPAVANGILRLTANPAFNYRWWTYCTLASAHSDGWLGLYVGRYTLAGGFDGAPANQQISLWSDDSWWSGAGSHSGTNSGYPLGAQFAVDSSHYYALWVWTGGSVHGAGWGTFSGSGAGANLSLSVPAITWELF